jgi:hypothetical protein
MRVHVEAGLACSIQRIASRISITVLLVGLPALAQAQERPPRFWNLTRATVAKFYLAPAGTSQWTKNQCENDKDGLVDVDERLRLTDISPGRFDARLVDKTGRECRAENIEIKAGGVFSLEEKDLKDCKP